MICKISFVLFFLASSIYAMEPERKRKLVEDFKSITLDERLDEKFLDYARTGNVKKVEELIDAVDINVQDEDGMTALMRAAEEGADEIVTALIDGGADLDIKGGIRGYTALIYAVIGGNGEAVHRLIKAGADLNIRGYSGYTALMLAVLKRDSYRAKELIKAGADLNIQDNDGNTALILAIKARCIKIAKKLIKAGADLNIRGPYGSTALIWAAIECDGECSATKILIKAGADLNIQNKNGSTALTSAAACGYEGIVKELLKEGADPRISNKKGQTALTLAIEGTQERILTQLDIDRKARYKEIVKELIDAGADLNIQDKEGYTPLIYVLKEINPEKEIAKELLDAGADPLIPADRWGGSALEREVRGMNVVVVRLFLNSISERLKQPHTLELIKFMDRGIRKALSQVDVRRSSSFQLLKEFDIFARKHPEDFSGLEEEIKRLMRLAIRRTRPFEEMIEYTRTSRQNGKFC